MVDNNLSATQQKEDMNELKNLYDSKQFNILEKKTKELITKYSNNVNLQNILGVALQAQGKIKESIDTFQKTVNLKPNFYVGYYNLGNAFKQMLSLKEAKICYEKCLKINPKYIEGYIGLGLILLDLNEINESSIVFKKAIKLNPKNTQLHRYLSTVTKYSKNDPHIKDMENSFSESSISDENKINLSFALGKAYEDIKLYDKAFSYWKIGNSLKRKKVIYSTQNQEKSIEKLKKFFTKELFQKNIDLENQGNKLIFIVGMPRSGTTLVQQILSSHPNIIGLGEKNELFQLIQKNFDEKISLKGFDIKDFSKINDKYLKNLNQFSRNGKHILIKDPRNFMWLGYIKLIFPNAKIIHCVRNPLDNCLSLYKNFFVGGVDFSFDLTELGQYYKLYLDLMEFWKKLLPNYYTNILYEELVNNQKNETSKLLKACNLEWNDNCMNFHKYIHSMSTGSNSINIHKSVYRSSIQYWKNYEKHLKILKEILNI